MGKDIRGIERGKCACGECKDFRRSDGATCGYCGCLPTDRVVGSSPSSLSDESSPETDFSRGTQRIVSVQYLFGRPVIASNFRLGKCHLELS